MKDKKQASQIRAELEPLDTKRLDAILDEQLHKQIPDGERVRTILEILKTREQGMTSPITPEIQKSWDKYRRDTNHGEKRHRRHRMIWVWALRAASAALVLGVLSIAIPQETEAENLWEKMGRWSDEVFSFFSSNQDGKEEKTTAFRTDNPGLQQVHDALVDMGVTVPVVPMWLPEGYELVECKVKNSANKNGVHARFSDGNVFCFLEIDVNSTDTSHNYYKDETDLIRYEKAGITHSIMRNKSKWTVVWTNDNVEGLFIAECPEDALYEILGSIYSIGE